MHELQVTVSKPAELSCLEPVLQLAFGELKLVSGVGESWTFDLSAVTVVTQDELRDPAAVCAFTLRKIQALYVQVGQPTRSLALVRLMSEVLTVLAVYGSESDGIRSEVVPAIQDAMAAVWALCGSEDVTLT